MESKVKLWLEVDGDVVFGSGRLSLLKYIDSLGSISKAANKLNMSYRAAWGKIKASEERLDIKLIKTQVGGAKGGGTQLTSKAKEILTEYQKYETEVQKKVDEIYQDRLDDFF